MQNSILLVHGPNLNLLGQRDVRHYGKLTLAELEKEMLIQAKELEFKLKTFQSNHEGALIDFFQQNAKSAVGIIINPGALTHYSYALHDAIIDTGLPCIEVHLSKVTERESWRRKSVIKPACIATFSGEKLKSYVKALQFLARHLGKFA